MLAIKFAREEVNALKFPAWRLWLRNLNSKEMTAISAKIVDHVVVK